MRISILPLHQTSLPVQVSESVSTDYFSAGEKKLTERLTDQLKAKHKFREKFHSAEELPLSD